MRLLPAALLASAGCSQFEATPGDTSGTEGSSSTSELPATEPCAPGETTACDPGHDGTMGVAAPQSVAEQGPIYTLSPQTGDGSCSSDFTFNGTPLKGTPSADWCQIQQAVNAVKAAGTGGTIELVNTGQAYRLTGPIMLNTDDITVVGCPTPSATSR